MQPVGRLNSKPRMMPMKNRNLLLASLCRTLSLSNPAHATEVGRGSTGIGLSGAYADGDRFGSGGV